MTRLMLIDGNSLTYRAFHALPTELMTTSGQVTNAVLGFTNMLIFLVKDHKPDGILVAWDRKEPTFRHEQLDTYKANRVSAPDILFQQVDLIKEILTTLNIPQIDKAGVEADDIIATIASKARDENIETLIVTGDRDSYQLVEDPNIKVVYNKRGVTDYVIYDESGIEEKTGVHPTKYIEYAALRGDPSDNLPGVEGVGEKTAAKLINTYGSIDGIYEAVEDQTPKLKQNLMDAEPRVRVNKAVMELLRNVELDLPELNEMKLQEYDVDEVKKVFDLLELNTVYKRLQEAFVPSGSEVSTKEIEFEGKQINTEQEFKDAIDNVSGAEYVALNFQESSGDRIDIISMNASDSQTVYYFSFDLFKENSIRQLFNHMSSQVSLITYKSKQFYRAILDIFPDLEFQFDISLASYLLDPAGKSEYKLSDLASTYTDFSFADKPQSEQIQLQFEETVEEDINQLCIQTRLIAELFKELNAAIKAEHLESLLVEIEMPLSKTLARMEKIGIGVNLDTLRKLTDEITNQVSELNKEIQVEAGQEFNVNSTKVLQDVLFNQLGLAPQKKNKTGFSTNQASLEKLKGSHPIIELLLKYREVEKLRSTYGQPLIDSVSKDGRIHATFRQTVARTGRLSSENPNLHNIPIRGEIGRNFRSVFEGEGDYKLLVADYNQIELRCIAHLSQDPGLIDAFKNDIDIHKVTASRTFGIPIEEVTKDQREKAKMVSYGLAYGMESYGLAQRLQISNSEAQEILDSFFNNFPSIQQYMDDAVNQARHRGYTNTLLGRRRLIPGLQSDNRNVRLAAERQAMNSGIQGLAADIFKIALVKIDKALTEHSFQSRLVLQVHDEVLVEVQENEINKVSDIVTDCMSNAYKLDVPLLVESSIAKTWAEAKG